MYESGRGVPKDATEASQWYRKAAEQGFQSAQFNLGDLYKNGTGVAKDEKEAFKWFRMAADKGNAMAQDRVGSAYQHGKGVSESVQQAVQWYRKSADQGYAAGQFSLGIMYEFGAGVSKDSTEAMSWYRKAAAQDYGPARNRLLEMETKLGIRPAAPAAAAPATASSVSKEDIRDMIQSALKPAEAPAPPKGISSDVDKPGYTTPENPDNFAVVIGVEKYATLPAADFAERDAESMRAHLMAMGYPARNIFFLSGQQATRAKIAQSVNTWLPGRVTPASTVFFYYSGHGAPDPATNQAYLVPMDGDPEDLDSTAYPIKLLYEKLGKLKSKQVIVALDSCFSGAGGRSVLAKGTRPLVGKIDLGGLPNSVVALTASDKSQISGTIEEQGHGAFTYYMLKGLEGGAKNGAGRVTAQSLHDYLTPKVRDAARLSNREQTPQLMNPKRAGSALR